MPNNSGISSEAKAEEEFETVKGITTNQAWKASLPRQVQGVIIKTKRLLGIYPKGLTLLLCVILSTITYANSYNYNPVVSDPPAVTSLTLDWEFTFGMGYVFAEQGLVSGRDFNFTYGPLGQLLFALPYLLFQNANLYSAFYTFFFLGSLLYWIMFALFLMAFRKLDWKYSAFIYLVCLFMQLNSAWVGSRALAILLPALVFARALSAPNLARRLLLSLVTGLACFTVFLYTYEIGIYSLAGCTICCGLFMMLGLVNRYATRFRFWFRFILPLPFPFPFRLGSVSSLVSRIRQQFSVPDLLSPFQTLPILLVIWVVFVAGNLGISLLFKLSSSGYENFFDFQLFVLEMVRGYSQVMGRVEGLTWFKISIVLLLAGYVIWFLVVNLRTLPVQRTYLFVSLLIPALLHTKTLLTRSIAPFYLFVTLPLVFLLIGYPGWQAKQNRPVWLAILIVFMVGWGTLSLGPATAVTDWVEGKNDVPAKVADFVTYNNTTTSISTPTAAPENKVLTALRQQVDPNPQTKLFTFPYHYSYAPALGKVNPHALVQSYVAMTPALQEKVVKELDQSLPSVEVLFSSEVPYKSDVVDDVPDPTRSPHIFEYIVSRFEVKAKAENIDLNSSLLIDGHFLVLKPRATPRNLSGVSLTYRQEGPTIRLTTPQSCTLVRLTSRIVYPVGRWLTRPNPLVAQFSLAGKPVVIPPNYPVQGIKVVPLEIGKSFTTYLPMYERNGANYRDLFSNRPVAGRNWDTINFISLSSGVLGVDANEIRIEKVECVNLV
jgi:hypothetical protein